MRHLLVGAATALFLALSFVGGSASAKDTTYLLTGGDLGSHAYLLQGYIPDADYTGWAPGVGDLEVEPPRSVAAQGYDLYRRYGTFALTEAEPEMRYYPNMGLIHNLWTDRWYRPPSAATNYLNRSIEEALALKDAGELADNPLVADLRQRRMHEVNYWMVPYSAGDYGTRSIKAQCDSCLGVIPNREQFVLEHLVDTVSGPPIPGSTAEPVYSIEYNGWFEGTGIGGFLGFYSPPAEGQSGRFWMSGYRHDPDRPYYETTPGFDASIQAALVGLDARGAAALTAGAGDPNARATAAGSALLALLLGGGLLVALARRSA